MKITCSCGASHEMADHDPACSVIFHQTIQFFLNAHVICRETQAKIALREDGRRESAAGRAEQRTRCTHLMAGTDDERCWLRAGHDGEHRRSPEPGQQWDIGL